MRWERKSKSGDGSLIVRSSIKESPQSKNRPLIFLLCMMISILAFAGCRSQETETDLPKEAETASTESALTGSEQPEEKQEDSAAGEETGMKMLINGTEVKVAWEDNESVEALRKMAEEELEITMSMYGGFEQVGSIGQDLPSNDEQITTEAGDIVLYSSDQIVVFYGSNSWAYTRLGHITDKTAAELEDLLGNGDVTIRFSMEDEK